MDPFNINNIETSGGITNEILEKKQEKLSKKQMKKLQKSEKWQEMKKLKKIKKKEMKLLKKNEPKKDIPYTVQKKKIDKFGKEKYKLALQNAQPIIIDCSFQNLMTEKEIKSLCMQLAYCHSINRKFTVPSQLTLTNYEGHLKDMLTKTNVEKWGIALKEKSYLEYFPKEQLIYLTGDAEEDLEEYDSKYFSLNYKID